MSLTRNRRYRPNPARGSVARAGWRGITGQRAGAVTDALGRTARSGLGPCAGPLRSKPRLRENGETTFDAVDREPIRANNQKPGRSHRPLSATTSCLNRRSRDRSCGRTPGDGRDGCAAGNRTARSRWVPALIPGAVLSSLTRPSTTVAIGRSNGQHSRTGFYSTSMFLEHHSIRGRES